MDKTSFPEKLAEERKRRGYTQKQIAQALGVSDRTYSKWETGENEMDISTLCRLAEFYGESPAVFFLSDYPDQADVRAQLGALPLGDAARSWFRLQYEALQGMQDAAMAHYRAHPEDLGSVPTGLTPPENPAPELAQKGRSLTTFLMPNLLAMQAAGPDLNLSLLLEPNEEGWAWLKMEETGLQEILRFLAMPGAVGCLRVLYSRKPDSLLSAGFVAREAGIAEEEAEAFLSKAAEKQLLMSQTMLRKGKEIQLYWPHIRVEAAAILALAKSLNRGLAQGHMLGCSPMAWLEARKEDDHESR